MIVSIDDPRIVSWIKEGKVFIYPTDTIYGIGCDARNERAVERIREIKGTSKPWSVIAPSKGWVRQYCQAGEELEKLPGPYTFIYESSLRLPCMAGGSTLGVRIPDHTFSALVEESAVPVVTTSVNATGEAPLVDIQQLSQQVKEKVDFVVDVGPIIGKPSTVIDCTQDPPKVLRA